MKFQQIGALFCSVLVISGCAASTSHNFFMSRYSLDTEEFDRGYETGIAFAKTEGPFNSSPKDVPSAMQKIIETESDSYQKGILRRLSRSKSQKSAVEWCCFLDFMGGYHDRSHYKR